MYINTLMFKLFNMYGFLIFLMWIFVSNEAGIAGNYKCLMKIGNWWQGGAL